MELQSPLRREEKLQNCKLEMSLKMYLGYVVVVVILSSVTSLSPDVCEPTDEY